MANLSDNFTRADNPATMNPASDGPPDWVDFVANSWGVSSNRAYNSVAAVSNHSYRESGAADAEVQVTMPVVSAGGPLFRWVSIDQYFVVSAVPGTLTLYRFNGGYTVIGTPYSSGAVADGCVVKASFTGPAIGVYLNGTQVISASDAQGVSATKHGIQNYNDTTTRFAAFSVADLSGAPAAPTYYAFTAGGRQYAVQT